MARRRIIRNIIDSLKKKPTETTQILKPNTASVYVTDYTNGGSKIVKTETTPATGQTKVITIRKSSPSSTPQITEQIYKNQEQIPTFLVTSQTAPLVNKSALRNFQERLKQARIERQTRLIRPLRPIQTLKNIGNKIDLLNKLETAQRNIETKQLRSYAVENKPLRDILRGAEVLGLSFTTETIRGVKGIIAFPKNAIKTLPKLPAIAVNLVKDRKNIIPMAKLRFKTFKEQQGYLLKTSPSTFLGKVGANIFLFKATGEGLKLAGKVTKPALKGIKEYLPQFEKKSKVIFTGGQFQKGDTIYSLIKFKVGKKIEGFAVGISKIGEGGKIVKSLVGGKAFKLKSLPEIREALGMNKYSTKKLVSFVSRDIGITTIKKGAIPILTLKKGVTIQKAIKNIIQVNIGESAQVIGKKFFMEAWNGVRFQKIKVKGIELRTFFSKSKIFTKNDLSLIVGKTRTNRKEIIDYLGAIKTINRNGETSILSGGSKALKTINKQALKQALSNVGSALSTGQAGATKILSKLSPSAKKFVMNNIKAGVVLIPKLNLKNIKLGGLKGVSAKSLTTSLTGLETPNGGSSTVLMSKNRQITRHIDYFQPVTNIITKTGTRTITRQKSIPKQQERFIEVLKSPSAQREIQRLTPRQTTRLKQYLRQYIKFYPKMTPSIVRVIPFSFVLKSKQKVIRGGYSKTYKMGFIVYGLNKGAYMRLNKYPLLKQDALSRGAYAIDRTTARTFKIVPVQNVKKFGRLIKREKGYFTLTKPKFREYQIVKGQKKIFTYKMIEKRSYAIDTKGEKKGLSLYRYLARLKKNGKY